MRALFLAAAVSLCAMLRGARGKVTVGINLSGMEEGNRSRSRPGYDYAVPSASEWEYFASKGIKLVRLPFRWERMQPNASGPLDEPYLTLMKTQPETRVLNTRRVRE